MTRGGLHIEIRGTVQGVGYRPWVWQLAERTGIAGTVRNETGGVVIDAFGPAAALDRFITNIRGGAPPAARVRSVTCTPIPYAEAQAFTISDSALSAERRVSIPADLATCPDCLRELFDPRDRRHRYPFINCTNCGPRYSIVTDAPYDRSQTSMSTFIMCDACRDEYDSPRDRRFHAQPNACPDCGPRLIAMTPQRAEVATDNVIGFAARSIRAGFTVAIKGLGGFHLACDARSSTAVKRLRDRKHREAKPLAIMVRDVAEAETLADLNDEERALLMSIERPIVLAKRRDDAPGDVPLIGLFLPYTPLHHLLLHDFGGPLVMTSGNISEEPMVTTNAGAMDELRDVADVFVMHDRDIVTRVDDSVVRIIADAPVLLRRARGYVPHSIDTPGAFAKPILACGAHLKNTFCIANGSSAFVGPHIGDLESFETLRSYEAAIERMEAFIGVRPEVVAHDLHPDYFSTRYALGRDDVQTIGVQHHHAHVASVMAEHRLDGPVIGIAYDGTGYGTDGTAWGGEILIATYAEFDRFATFRPIALAGGDQAIREPWRVALALLDDTFDGEAPTGDIPLFRDIAPNAIATIRRAIAWQLNAPLARGVGRYFDALGSLILGIPNSRYEGDVAFQWNMAADPNERGRYPFVIHSGVAPWEIDPRPMVRAAVDDLIAWKSPATISARFHNTIAAATVEIARAALAYGDVPVVLSGGCFQNARLAESVIDGLRPFARVFMNREVPPGDGGIALGQAFVANARIGRNVAKKQELIACV